MVLTRNTIERRIEGIKLQILELKNLILARSLSRRGRSHKRHSLRRRGMKATKDGEVENIDDDSDTTYSSSRESSRDFGGQKLRIPIFSGENAYV